MSRTAYIYALVDPRKPGEYRYVGWTLNMRKRLNTHIAQAIRDNHPHRSAWIRSLLAESVRPGIIELDQCPEELWPDREIYWIAKSRADGHSLTNHTDGGEGRLGGRASDETKARMSQAKLRNANKLGYKDPPETVAKRAQALIGNTNAHGGAGKPKSPEHRAAMKAGLLQYYANRWVSRDAGTGQKPHH